MNCNIRQKAGYVVLDRGVAPREDPDNVQLATSTTLLFGTDYCRATLFHFNRRCQEQDDSILKQDGILGGDVLEQELPQLDILESIDDGVDIGIDNNNDDDGRTLLTTMLRVKRKLAQLGN